MATNLQEKKLALQILELKLNFETSQDVEPDVNLVEKAKLALDKAEKAVKTANDRLTSARAKLAAAEKGEIAPNVSKVEKLETRIAQVKAEIDVLESGGGVAASRAAASAMRGGPVTVSLVTDENTAARPTLTEVKAPMPAKPKAKAA